MSVIKAVLYQVAQKNIPLDSAISLQLIDFYQNFRIYRGRSCQQSLKISLKYFHCFKNYSF